MADVKLLMQISDVDWVDPEDKALSNSYFPGKPRVKVEFLWLPRRCHYNNKILWLTKAYCVSRDDYVDEKMYIRCVRRWYDEHTYVKLLLMS